MGQPCRWHADVVMRESDETSGSLFSYVDLEARIPERHPLRIIRQMLHAALVSPDSRFRHLYRYRPSCGLSWR